MSKLHSNPSTEQIGYVLFAHGSSVESANQAVREVAAEMARQGGLDIVETAFLELGKPDLATAIDLIADRVQRVVVVPYFLTMGIHLKRDLPKLVEDYQQQHPGIRIEVTAPLDQHPAMVTALVDRARRAADPHSSAD